MMENQKNMPVSGVSIQLPECPKCERRNARGVYMIREFDGAHIWKCDECGQKRKYGNEEAFAMLIDQEAKDYQHSIENRERWQREFTEKFNQDYNKATETMTATPDVVENFTLMTSPHFDRGPKGEES